MATYVDLNSVIKRLQEMGVTGNIFFVDTAGNDANPGTYAQPCLTIDHTVGLCAADHDDAIVVMDTLDAGYDENVNVDGIQFDVAGVTLVGAGAGDIYIDNTNVAATATAHITVGKVSIYGVVINQSVSGVGILLAGSYCHIGAENMQTTVLASGLTGIQQTSGSDCKFRYIDLDDCDIGIDFDGAVSANEIDHCQIKGDGGTTGINFTNTGPTRNCYVHDNSITDFSTGIDVQVGCDKNIFHDNSISLCDTPITEANPDNINAWINNKVSGEISRGGLVQSDLASINSRVFPEAGHNTSGKYWFVSTLGSDADGNGTWASPYRTIRDTVALASDGDTIICVAPDGGQFNENVVNAGVQVNPAITILGVGLPVVTNNKVGATSVVRLVGGLRFTGFQIYCQVAGGAGVVMDGTGARLDHNQIVNSGVGGVGVFSNVGLQEVDNNGIYGYTVGIDCEMSGMNIHDNEIGNCGTAIELNFITDSCRIRNNFLFHLTPAGTISFDVAATCGVNVIADNRIQGYEASAILAPTAFINNHIISQLGTNYTPEQDLAETDRQPVDFGRTGMIFYVKKTGNDANPGTYDQPFLTIDAAVNACVSARNDTVVVISNGFNHFDENVNVDGVEMDLVGLNLVGINNPIIENSNGGAVSVLTVSNRHNKIFNLTVRPSGAGVIGIDVQNMGCEMNNLRIYGGTSTEVGIADSGGESKIIDVEIDGVATGIYSPGGLSDIKVRISGVTTGIWIDGGSYNVIHDSVLSSGTTGVNITGVGGGNVVVDSEIFGFAVPIQTVAGGDFARNDIDRAVLAHTITVAHGTAEQTAADLTLWTSGKLSVIGDMSDLVANEPVGVMVTLRLKAYVDDFTERLLDQKTFVLGSDTLYPILTCPAGSIGGLNTQARVTVQMSVAVGANRTLNLRQIMED